MDCYCDMHDGGITVEAIERKGIRPSYFTCELAASRSERREPLALPFPTHSELLLILV